MTFFIIAGAAMAFEGISRSITIEKCGKNIAGTGKAGVQMVDTVWLTQRGNFGIYADNLLHEVQNKDNGTGETTPAKWYFNFGERKSEKIEKKLYSKNIGHEGNITIHSFFGQPLLMFNVSLPKMLHGHSLAETTPADFDKCADGIYDRLSLVGIDIDRRSIPQMNVARIDYCKNIPIDGNIADYVYFLASCDMERATPDHKKEKGTVLFKNSCWQFSAYNKIKEIKQDTKQRYAAAIDSDTPEKMLRFEYRIMRGANVKRILKRRTFAECFDAGLSRKLLLNKFDSLNVDLAAQQRINNSELSFLFANFRHAQVERYIAAKIILQEVNFDLELLRQYLQVRYKERQMRNIISHYRQVMDSMRAPAQRDIFREMRQKLAA